MTAGGTYSFGGGGPPVIFSNKPLNPERISWTKENDQELRDKTGLSADIYTGDFRRLLFLDESHWVTSTKLYIDHITILCDLTAKVTASHFPTSGELHQHLVKTLPDWLAEMSEHGFEKLNASDSGAKIPAGAKAFKLVVGERKSAVIIQILKGTKAGAPPRIRFEFNPRKVGGDAVSGILMKLAEASMGDMKVSSLVKTARVTRIDIAVDVIGALPADLSLAPASGAKKTHAYFSADFALETAYFLTSKSGKGSAGSKVYDKQAEKAAKFKSAIYGGLPCARVEISKQPKNAPWPLSTLQLIANPLLGTKLGWLPELYLGRPPRVKHLLDSLRFRGHLQELDADGYTIAQNLKALDSKLFEPEALWNEWSEVLADAGLGAWIAPT